MEDKLTKEEMEELFKINSEIQMRCGDGSGSKPTSHSEFCRCGELKERKREILNGK